MIHWRHPGFQFENTFAKFRIFRAHRSRAYHVTLGAHLYQQDLAYIHATGFGALARGAAPDIVQRLKNAPIPVKHVIDAGCGAGPLAGPLAAAGFAVTGIDQSPELLALAQETAPSARFLCASIYEAGLPPCEAVIALGEPLSYHEETDTADVRVRGFFQQVSEVLPRGGIFIFDVIETGDPSLSARFWTSSDDWAVLAETIEDPAARTLTRKIETFRRTGDLYRRSKEVHKVRIFDSQTIRAWLEESGFTVSTGTAYGEEQPGQRRRAFFATR
jgi:SAM-dependent methyltransferase